MNLKSTIAIGTVMMLGLSSCSHGFAEEAAAPAQPIAAESLPVATTPETTAAQIDAQASALSETSLREVAARRFEAAWVEAGTRYDSAETLDQAITALADLVQVIDETAPYLDGQTDIVIAESDLVELALRFGGTAEDVLQAMLNNHVVRDYFGDDPYVVPDVSDAGQSGWYEVDLALGSDQLEVDDQLFWEPVLAELHSGPWGDHLLGRCLDTPRTSALHTESATGGQMGETDLDYAYVVQRATFGSVEEARASFDEVDLCYLDGAVSQFAEALGWYGYDVASISNEVSTEVDGQQDLFMEFDRWDLPISLWATQVGNEVGIAISYGVDPTFVQVDGNVMPGTDVG